MIKAKIGGYEGWNQRTERQSYVSTYGENRQSGCHLISREKMGCLEPFGMIGCDSQSTDDYQQEDKSIMVGEGQKGQPKPGAQTSDRKQECLFFPVGQVPEKGLNDRGRDIGSEHKDASHRIG